MHHLAEHLVALPAEQPLGLGIHEGTATIGIGGHDPLAERIGQAVEEAVALLDLVFLLLQAQRGAVERFDQLLDFLVAVKRPATVSPRTLSRRPAKFVAWRSTRMARARNSSSSAVLARTRDTQGGDDAVGPERTPRHRSARPG